MPIHLLPNEVASQIAAGEVVERPASAVKELLENALDARASQVVIRVEQAGKRLIEISDDGVGIPADEMALAVSRHATSKLSNAEDLFHITTLGFRGEALASIGSVSRFTLTSRPAASASATRLRVDAGKMGVLESIGAPVGTQVLVEDLFYNVPARLKFLKQDSTERQQIDGLVTRYALAYPSVRFQLHQDGRPVLQTSGNGNRREILSVLYGVDVARNMIEVALTEEGYTLAGFSSPISITRSNRREVTFFINGRWIQDASLNSALMQAYHTLLMVGRFPMAVIFIEIPPEEVDVNVHPAKAEVRFRHADRVFSLVQRGVRRALLAYSPVPQVASSTWRNLPTSTAPLVDPAWEMAAQLKSPPPLARWDQLEQTDSAPEPTQATPHSTPAPSLPSGQLPLLRLVGQVGGTYIIAEGPDGLYLIDQHAAHERVLFERMMKHNKQPLPSQALLQPAILHLPPQQTRLLGEQLSLLAHLGFDIEAFGPETFRVRAIPAMLTGGDPLAAVRSVVEDFEEDETPLQAEVENRLAARICKRSAVKGGQTLSVEEQRNLLRDLESCQSPRTCPHGRPTMIHLSVDLLERQFGRRGSR